MNGLWQRVMNINNNGQPAVNKEDDGEEQKTESVRSRFPKVNWIRKRGNYSPIECQVPSSPLWTSRTRVAGEGQLCNTYEAVTLRRPRVSPETLDMPDLESIIRDFEMGYLSPSKQDLATDRSKQKNFVKKIVEAFEVKYKVFEDLKTAREMKEFQEDQKVLHQQKRKSGFFVSPSKSSPEASKRLGKADDSVDSKQSWENERAASRTTENFSTPSKYNSSYWNNSEKVEILGAPDAIASEEDRNCSDYSNDAGMFSTPSKNTSDDSKNCRRSGIFSSPFNRSDSKDSDSSESEIYKSPVNLDRQNTDSSSDNSDIFKFDKEDSDEKLNFHFSPVKISSLDETKTVESIDLDDTLSQPEETIFLSGTSLPKTSTMIDEFPGEELPRVSTIDRTPKIVGAFLKKPIEVEDTSIDWIPITGKKLPRKRSLKKLLSLLTGKKSLEKRNKMFSSQRNLYEDSREFQDSGYDEKSCSSSSLTSLISFTETLLQQDSYHVEPEKRSNFNTFRSRNSEKEQDDEAFYETCPVARKSNERKLLLIEVPREEVKLDLGPAFPPPKTLTMSLDRKTQTRKTRSPSPVYEVVAKVPKHPNISKIPKHPFVSMTKMDQLENFNEEITTIVKNDPREVEFHRADGNVRSQTLCRNSSLGQSHYDVPRKLHAKSDPEISQIYRPTGTKGEEPIYDVPRIHSINRPRSSVYENAVSLRRRSANLVPYTSDLYPQPCAAASHYDTVKPRNRAVFDRNGIRSDSDLAYLQRTSVF